MNEQDLNDLIEQSEELEQAVGRLSNPDWIWEAVGPDGVVYPNHRKYRRNGLNDPQQVMNAMQAHDDDVAIRLGKMAMHYLTAEGEMQKLTSACAVGEIIIKQILTHLEITEELNNAEQGVSE